MSKLMLPAAFVAVLAVAACSAGPVPPSGSPLPTPSASPSAPAVPSVPPSVSPPSVTPPPSVAPPTARPPTDPPPIVAPTPAPPDPPALGFTPAERYLLDGVRRGATGCEPAGGSDDLPRDAIAGIECNSTDPAVARVGFYLFGNTDDMLNAYVARMTAEGVRLDSGSCLDGEADAAYVPGEGLIPYRVGCFVNDEGYGNYRLTMPGYHVYIGILGRTADLRALDDFAWLGNQDVPGTPTLWGEPS